VVKLNVSEPSGVGAATLQVTVPDEDEHPGEVGVRLANVRDVPFTTMAMDIVEGLI
jgi:hypothetical protein